VCTNIEQILKALLGDWSPAGGQEAGRIEVGRGGWIRWYLMTGQVE